MATNPITSPLPADLPENWSYGQTVAPNGTDAGLSQQHGYNYLMEQVNAAQEGVNTLNTNAGELQGQIDDIVDGTTAVGNADKLDGKQAADFAPAGYGLGSSPVYVSDWNEATKNGWYSSASVSAANQPRDGYFTGITCYTNDSYIVQRVTVYNSTNVPYVWYERRCVSGQWSEWRQDMPVAVQSSAPVRTDVLWAW